jgi:integrating conjugative element protein (TIGR03755 family)
MQSTSGILSILGRCPTVALLGLLLMLPAGAQTIINPNVNSVTASGAVIDDTVFYSIGGGHAVSMTHTGNMLSIGVGLNLNNNLICGNMDIVQTIRNQLNGVTNGFRTLESTVIQGATAAVASLPAIIIQRADPGLYNLLTNGVLQARLDFDRSKLQCRAIAKDMSDLMGGELKWSQLAEGMSLKNAVGSGDAVSAIATAESSNGNNGVPWIGGINAGGTGQPTIKVITDVTTVGYNLVNGRAITDATTIDPATCATSLTCQFWPSPSAAAKWAVRVLGEREQATCDTCIKTKSTPGVGLTPLVQEVYTTKLQNLQQLVTGAQPTSGDNLAAAGSDAVPITRGVIEALRDEPDQDVLASRLASEVALSSVLEQALTLQRTLLTGREEPNIAANQLAQDAVSHQTDTLEREINNLKTELELRRELSGNSPMAIIQRRGVRGDASRGTFQGDTDRDRLNEIQKPRN